MGSNTFARKLGIGVRVASQILREHSRTALENSSSAATPAAASAAESRVQRPARPAVQARNVGRATKRFGEAVWGPFVHVGSVLWLEVTGLFFGIFALFFAQNVYRLRHATTTTAPGHIKLLIYSALTVVFLYFTCTSFYRARRRSRAKAAR
jgi:hypothetical protein